MAACGQGLLAWPRAGWGSPKCSQIRGTGKRWCSYCPWDTEARPVPSSAVPCGGPTQLAARFRRPETEVGARRSPAHWRRWRKPAPRGSDRLGQAFTSDRAAARPRRPPSGAPSPPLRVLGPARHLRPGTRRRGRVRGNRTLLGTRKGCKRQGAAAPACAAEARGLRAVQPVEGACPSACARRREGQGVVPPARPGKARGGGVPHVSLPEAEGAGREESACVDLVVGSSSFWGQRVGSTGLDLSSSSALADSSHGGS